jgi:hypothetical protein
MLHTLVIRLNGVCAGLKLGPYGASYDSSR